MVLFAVGVVVMATQVNEFLTEIRAALSVVRPEREGFNDLARLNLETATQAVVSAAIKRWTTRLTKLEAVEAAIQALLDDGYPTVTPVQAESPELTDLLANRDTILAALARVQGAGASVLNLAAGAPEPK